MFPPPSLKASRKSTKQRTFQLYHTIKKTRYFSNSRNISKQWKFASNPFEIHEKLSTYGRIIYLERQLDFLGWLNRDRILPELAEYRINGLESTINLLSDFSSGKHDLSGHKDQEHDFRVDHPVNQTRKQFRLVLSLATCTRGR